VEKALAAGEAHDVLVDEEVADEAHLFDHAQLALHARHHVRRGVRVAAGEACARIGPKLFTVFRKVRAEHLARLVAAVEGDAALLL
jgi:hypothetical protein